MCKWSKNNNQNWHNSCYPAFDYGETGNTGMGLHIVKRSIENYGGFIYIEDNQSQGVIFVISLEKSA